MKLQEKLIEITSEYKYGGDEYLEMLHIMLDMAWNSSTEFNDVYKKYYDQRIDRVKQIQKEFNHQFSKEQTDINDRSV
jgi:hypothetical protein